MIGKNIHQRSFLITLVNLYNGQIALYPLQIQNIKYGMKMTLYYYLM